MSRCFPFPPPGYEKKPRSSEQGDLLAKEKHREKKHKKEKDKEKREGKERKDKDRSRDKHKEKRDKKEKHKDKKKDKDKNKTSEDRRKTEHLSEVHHEDILGFDKQKAEEINDSKFKEEFGRRIRDDEQGAANLMVKDLSSTTHKRGENISCSTGTGNENSTGNKVVADVTGTVQRRNEKLAPPFQKQTEGSGIAVNSQKRKVANSEKAPQFNFSEQGRKEILTPQMQKRIESMGTAITMEKQRAARNEKIGAFTSAEQKRNHATGRPMDKVPISVQRTEGIFSVNSMQKERVASNDMVSNAIGSTTKRNDGIEQSTRSLTSSVPRKFEDMGAAPAMEKERSSFPNITRTERRTEGLPVGKSTDKKAEGKEKTKEKKSEDEKKEGHRKRKEKDKDRHKEKKKEEKKREKEHKHKKHDKLKESGIKDQIGSLNNKTLGPHVETINTIGADGINKKRKEFERNGFLHEPQIDGRPNKLQRTSAPSSKSTVENGRPSELIPNTKLEAINHFKNERGLDNNGNHLNGKVKIQPSDVCRPPIVPPPITVDSSKKDQIPSIKPHPDTKYLSTIYSIPKMEELRESHDQDWLFSSENPRSSTKLKADGTTPQVWAKGLQIEAADIFALPYVIPY